MASGSTAPFSGEFVDLENVPKLPEGISAEQIFEQNADAIRQAAESRHAAGLSQVEADGGFFDAFVDASKIASKSKISLADNTSSLTSKTFIASFEENITYDSSGTNSSETVKFDVKDESNIPINAEEGSKVGELDAPADSSRVASFELSDSEDSIPQQPTEIFARLYPRDSGISLDFGFYNDPDAFGPDTVIVVEDIDSDLNTGQWNLVKFVVDWNNQKYDAFVDGTQVETNANFGNSATNINNLFLASSLNTFVSSTSSKVWHDGIGLQKKPFKLSGTVTEKQFTFTDSQGNSFSPSKVGIFAEQTLNGQSITYDLKDSTGTVVKTFNQNDLNQLQSVNTTDDTFQVEANFTGNGTATPELEFLDVRGV
jgi:hypothetical protein